MQLRTALTLGAAVLAVGLLGLTATATASIPGSTVTNIEVDGSSATGSVAKSGLYNVTGSMTHGGSTYACTSGFVGGNVQRGAYTAGTTAMTFTTLTLVCFTGMGTYGIINMKSGCSATVSFNDLVHTGLTDTGAPGGKFHRVAGTLTIDPACSAMMTIGGGICTVDVSGHVPAYFGEALISNTNQTLGLNGAGLSFSNGTGICGPVMNGAFTLNDIRYLIPKTIDFQ